jgi:hypothetical protein
LQPNRDTKAELNRRSQACEVLAGTGVRVAENGLPSGGLPAELVKSIFALCASTRQPSSAAAQREGWREILARTAASI